MANLYRLALTICFTTVLCSPLWASSLPVATCQEVGLDSQVVAKLDTALQSFIDEQKRAGFVVAVVRRGKVVYHRSLGMQDIATKKPMTQDTIFRIYSMTKPITSVAAMILYDRGLLKLDTPVGEIVPEFADLEVVVDPYAEEVETVKVESPMTVLDLFRHTAGLTYGFFSNTNVDKLYRKAFNNPPPDANLHAMATAMGDLPLLYQPGSKWHYSYATDILGHVVERLSGQPLDVFLAQNIFKPLGMTDTGFYVSEAELERFATNYGPQKEGGLKVIDAPQTSRFAERGTLFSGGGGLVSTSSDYIRFCLMLLNNGTWNGQQILKPETVALMTRNHLPPALMPIAFGKNKRHGVGFGLGFSVRVQQSDWEPASRTGEYGWGGAASTHFWISPEDEIAVVVLSQYMPYNDQVERELKPIIYDALQ